MLDRTELPPFDYEAFANGVRGMPREQVGDYIRLLCAMYDAGGAIENDPEKLRVTLGCRRPEAVKWVENLIRSGKIFLGSDGRLHNRRTDLEVAALKDKGKSPSAPLVAAALPPQSGDQTPKKPTKTVKRRVEAGASSRDRSPPDKEISPKPPKEINPPHYPDPSDSRSERARELFHEAELTDEVMEQERGVVVSLADHEAGEALASAFHRREATTFRRCLAWLNLPQDVLDGLALWQRHVRKGKLSKLAGDNLARKLFSTGNAEAAARKIIQSHDVAGGYGEARRLPPDFKPDISAAIDLGMTRERATAEAAKFGDYFRAAVGERGIKSDWSATWRNWCRRAMQPSRFSPAAKAGSGPTALDRQVRKMREKYGNDEATGGSVIDVDYSSFTESLIARRG